MSTRTHLRSTLVVVGSLIAQIANFGCATVVALDTPGRVYDEEISLGMHRSEVEMILKHSKLAEFPEQSGTTVRYEYGNGPHQGSKARVVIYIAGDVFTLFLSELLFWPIELYAKSRADRVATSYYDSANILAMWKVTRPGGEDVLISMGERPTFRPVESSNEADGATTPGGESPPSVTAGPVRSGDATVDEPENPVPVEASGEVVPATGNLDPIEAAN